MNRTSTCSCGSVRLTAKSDPVRVSICHCFDCQKRTGSVFGVQARFLRDQVTLEGETTQYVRVADEDEKLPYHFCPKCGSTVFWFLESMPEIVGTGVGNFTDPEFPSPSVAVFENRKHHWVDLPNLKIQHFGVINQ